MTVSPGDLLVASARFRDNQGNDCVNVYNFRSDFATGQDDNDVFDAVDAYLTSVYTEWDVNIDNDMEPYDLKVDVVEFQGGDWKVTGNVGFGPWGSGITPTGSSDPLPAGNAILGQFFTGLGKHTGKKFFGGFTDAILDTDGNVLAAAITSIIAGVVKFLTPYVVSVGNELVLVVLDRLDGTVRDVIGVGASDVIAYQRRRRPGTGS